MRSQFALSLPLVRYSAFIAWGGNVRRFHQLILSVSHQGKAAAMTAWRLAARPPGQFLVSSLRLVLRVVFSFRIICSLIIVYSCRSRRDGGIFYLSWLVLLFCAPPRQILRPLSRCLIRFAHPSRFSFRLASRLGVSFSCRLVVRPVFITSCLTGLPHGLLSILRSRRFVQLISPFSTCLDGIVAS